MFGTFVGWLVVAEIDTRFDPSNLLIRGDEKRRKK